jgi:DNA repair protein RadC
MNATRKNTTKTVTTSSANTSAFPFAETALLEATLIREVRVSYLATERVRFAVKEPRDVAAFVRSVLHDNSREHVVALYLDGGHRVGAYSLISIGLANLAQVHPREIYQRAIAVGAVSLVLAHNHPSGQLEPSREDRELTTQLSEAGRILGIKLLDHVIVSDEGQTSLKERGLM